MAAPALGILGVGHLAQFLVEGFYASDRPPRILLSPRNRQRSRELARRFPLRVAKNNRDVVSESSLVVIATRPSQAREAVAGLPWNERHVVVSVAAGVGRKTLSEGAAPATLVRAMPLSCAAIGESPTCLYPGNPAAADCFARLGPVFQMSDEDSFEAACVMGAFYAWTFALAQEAVDWLDKAGLESTTAVPLVARTLRGASGMMVRRSADPFGEVLRTLATPGGITERGLEVLRDREAFPAWQQACDAAYQRLSSTTARLKKR